MIDALLFLFHRVQKQLALGHLVSKQLSEDLNPGPSTSKPVFFPYLQNVHIPFDIVTKSMCLIS